MSRVLVTGASGFVGRASLLPLELLGFEVHALARSAAPAVGGKVTWHRGDILDRPAFSALINELRPTHLLHFAWFVEHGTYWTSPENHRWQSRTVELLTDFLEVGGQRFVGAGTCAEYDWELASPLAEESPLRPITVYGQAKAATFRQLMAQAEAQVAWGRIFWAFGPYENERRFVPSLCRSLLRAQPAPMGSGGQVRELAYVDDVGSAFAALVASRATGAVNVGAGAPTTLLNVAERIAASIGRSDLLRVGQLKDSSTDPAVLIPETAKLRNDIGFRPQFGLLEGLERTIAYWRDK